MIVSISQPAYLPWLGYFHRIIKSDLHIVLDHVQFEKQSFTNRNKLRNREGWYWLTVPVKTKGLYAQVTIDELAIENQSAWGKKHWASLQRSYAKAPFFSEHGDFFKSAYGQTWNHLVDLTQETNGYLLGALGIDTPLMYSSKMGVGGKKDELIVNLCREVGASHYISGPLGRDYIHEDLFLDRGIEVSYHDYEHPTYPQNHPGFEPYMAIVDLLFNLGPQSGDFLRDDLG
jgi:hypothetical protein